jgi:HlyD family secretion protein
VNTGLGRRRAIALAAAAAVVLLAGWLLTTRGPLSPPKVTVDQARKGPLTAETFGVGTVEARRGYTIGPTVASRVLRVLVDQGDAVKAGQLLAELDPIDLDERLAGARMASERAANAVLAAQAQVAESRSRAALARASAARFADLNKQGFFSRDAADAKAHEAVAAQAAADAAQAQLESARRDRERSLADVAGAGKMRAQARLVSPVDAIVSARLVEPGSTVVAGAAVLQLIDPASLWVRARIDQGQAGGIRVGQTAQVVRRSEAARPAAGRVTRVDLVSDAVTEERIVNIDFASRPESVSVGELVEVTIHVTALADAVSVPTAAIRRVDRQDGVWRVRDGRAAFQPVRAGIATLDGRTQIVSGLAAGDEVVVHSEQALKPDSRVKVVDAIVRAGS